YLAYAEQSLSTTLAVATNLMPPLPTQITEDIQAIREQVDWVIVSFRWQRNLRAYPESWQINLSRLAIDQGADLVVGYHPQLTQGAEIYNGRVIAYSLGSSIEEYVEEYSDEPIPDRDTVTLKVTLQDQEMGIEFLPIQLRQGEATLAEGEVAEMILESFHQASSLFDQPMRSPISLDARVRFSLPAAPDSELPTDPFLER
ncbi:poly-gamma-glutamate biosynthesis protein, partial [filamentous cyanobacterium CCP1]